MAAMAQTAAHTTKRTKMPMAVTQFQIVTKLPATYSLVKNL